jgi:hypothetical protein
MLLKLIFTNTLMSAVHPTNFNYIKYITARGLWMLVRYARGTCVYFSPKRVAESAGVQDTPMIRHLVRYVLDELAKKEYIYFMRRKQKYMYYINRDSPLWELIKQSSGPEDVLSFLEKVVV